MVSLSEGNLSTGSTLVFNINIYIYIYMQKKLFTYKSIIGITTVIYFN